MNSARSGASTRNKANLASLNAKLRVMQENMDKELQIEADKAVQKRRAEMEIGMLKLRKEITAGEAKQSVLEEEENRSAFQYVTNRGQREATKRRAAVRVPVQPGAITGNENLLVKDLNISDSIAKVCKLIRHQ